MLRLTVLTNTFGAMSIFHGHWSDSMLLILYLLQMPPKTTGRCLRLVVQKGEKDP